MADPLASRTVERCRACGSGRLHRYLDMGRTPLANSYLDESLYQARKSSPRSFGLQLCLDQRACPS